MRGRQQFLNLNEVEDHMRLLRIGRGKGLLVELARSDHGNFIADDDFRGRGLCFEYHAVMVAANACFSRGDEKISGGFLIVSLILLAVCKCFS